MMTKADAKYAILKDEERALLYAHCSRHLVGFISEGDADFFGAGVIVAIEGTWAIATAAHVATKLSLLDSPCLVFPGPRSPPDHNPPRRERTRRSVRYGPIPVVVGTGGRNELDLAVIVPRPEVFIDVPGIAAVNLRLREANPRVVSGRFCIVAGLPRRLQDRSTDMIVTTNIVSSHFVACPEGARPDDVAINWVEVFQLDTGKHEDSPDAGGFMLAGVQLKDLHPL